MVGCKWKQGQRARAQGAAPLRAALLSPSAAACLPHWHSQKASRSSEVAPTVAATPGMGFLGQAPAAFLPGPHLIRFQCGTQVLDMSWTYSAAATVPPCVKSRGLQGPASAPGFAAMISIPCHALPLALSPGGFHHGAGQPAACQQDLGFASCCRAGT